MYYALFKVVNTIECEDCAGIYYELGDTDFIRYFKSTAKDRKRAFCNAIRAMGYTNKRGTTFVVDDIDCGFYIMLKERKTCKPLFYAYKLSEEEIERIYDIDYVCRPSAIY